MNIKKSTLAANNDATVHDFSYSLPQELIAQTPAAQRRDSRLLCLNAATGAVEDRSFQELPTLLRAGDLLVLNDTRVMRARLFGRRPTGGKVEVLIERVLEPHLVLAQVKPAKSHRIGAIIQFERAIRATVQSRRADGFFVLEIIGQTADELMRQQGHVPLPPYITRGDDATDGERYQTVYARRAGAVAAPTAGLHFDDALLAQTRALGVEHAFVTLHVGAGTFQPLRVKNIAEHKMHRECLEVSNEVCSAVARTRARGGRVIAVGTTSVRALESAAAGGTLHPLAGETDIFITPGYRFRVVEALITNFHLPESTLLMLVCAFAGRETTLAAYAHAVKDRYRFYSYGDAMFITPQKNHNL